MKKYILIFLTLLLHSFCFADGALSERQKSKFDEYLSQIVSCYHIPGMAFFITDSECTIFERAYGQCENLNQNFFIGSMSKSYTALCVMQLCEKGLLNIDDDISLYLPDYTFSKPVTIRSLLNHTSGFDTHAKITNAKVSSSYGKYEYSNANYDLLGKLIEVVSGLPYDEYVRENIFLPLGMNDSVAAASKIKDSEKLLKGNRNYFGFFVKGDADYPSEKSWFHEPAGFISVTPNDHAKYLRMYLKGGLSADGKRIIKKETIDLMWYDNVPLGSGENAFYGRGWNFMKHDGMKIVFHGGQVENYISYMFILPDSGLAVCFMINANDQFGMNELMDNAFWNSLLILKDKNPEAVKRSSYILIHLALDVLYLLIILLAAFLFARSFSANKKAGEKSEPSVTGKASEKKRKVILLIFAYVIFPALLLSFTRLFFATPLWVVKSYVPDLFCVIVISTTLIVLGGIIRTTCCFVPGGKLIENRLSAGRSGCVF